MHLVYKSSSSAAMWWAHNSVSVLVPLFHIPLLFQMTVYLSSRLVTERSFVSSLSLLSLLHSRVNPLLFALDKTFSQWIIQEQICSPIVSPPRKKCIRLLDEGYFVQDYCHRKEDWLNSTETAGSRVFKCWCELVEKYWQTLGRGWSVWSSVVVNWAHQI